MIRRLIYIHIGTHKTASTSIQHFLSTNADALRQEGLVFPESGRYLFGHHHIAWELRDDARLNGRRGFVTSLLDELQRNVCRSAVLTSEDFEYLALHAARLRGFVDCLRAIDFEPVFVVFFRERRAYLESLAGALANHGVHLPFAWYEEQLQSNDAVRVHGDWWYDFDRTRFVSRWTSITEAQLMVFDYDRCTEGKGVVPEFLRAIGAGEDLIALAASWPRLNARNI